MNEADWICIESEGFMGLVGAIWHRPFDDGPVAHFRFQAEDRHRNRAAIAHGGMLMTYADRAMGITARRHDLSRKQATAQLDVHFIRPVRIGDTVDVECRAMRETASLAFISAVMSVDGHVVLTAQGLWKYIDR